MKKNPSITIACVSMTHLGLIHASAFATKGFQVICYDENKDLIARLRQHNLPVKEPKLDELQLEYAANLEFTDKIDRLSDCDLVFIACDVPTDDKGNSQLNVIDQLVERVRPILSAQSCLIILSQVPPGFTRNILIDKHRLFYQVETLIFGKAVDRALYPERYIVGCHHPERALPKAYLELLSAFACPILKMRYESAELAKISINMFLVSTVSTTNTLAEICENIGADWEEIAPALRLDQRIGPAAYLSPGLGIAGGNLERDLNTILKLGSAHATDVNIVNAFISNSQHRRDWVYHCLEKNVLNTMKNPRICVLGLAYKPDTHSVKNSPSLALIHRLKNYSVQTHDPIVQGDKLSHAIQHDDMFDAIAGADVVIIMTAWTNYQTLSLELLKKKMRGNIVIDPFQVLKFKEYPSFNYFTLGKAPIETQSKEVEHA